MTENFEVENEGEMNIAKIMKLSNKLSHEKKLKLDNHKRRRLSSSSVDSIFSDKKLNEIDNLNNSAIIDKNKIYIKSEDNNSTTSKSSINDKIKKVTFSTVEIIRVKNYKRYNKLNTAKKNEEENNSDFNCILF